MMKYKNKVIKRIVSIISSVMCVCLSCSPAFGVQANTNPWSDVTWEVGEEFTASGWDWVIIGKDDEGNALVAAKYLVGSDKFNNSESDGNDYQDSVLEAAMERFYHTDLTDADGTAGSGDKKLTEIAQPSDYRNKTSASSGGLSAVDANGIKSTFALSKEEVEKYFPVESDRKIDYEPGGKTATGLKPGSSPKYWWLRSPSINSSTYAYYVNRSTGTVTSSTYVTNTYGIRPALWVKIPTTEGGGEIPAGETPRVLFMNIRDMASHLFISKTVVNADERYPAPKDALFTFVLSLDGKPVSEMIYRVYNTDGQEVFKYVGGEELTESKSNKITYMTDRNGTFTLKDGQTAKFEYVGAGKSYKVTETVPDNFEQIVPAGGQPAEGTVLPDGTVVAFINRYTPAVKDEKTSIVINKGIVFPEGYTAPESPDFNFVIKLKNERFSFEDYTISDTLTGRTIGTGTTDVNGGFTLKGWQTATFSQIPVGVDYEITEKSSDGWRVVGQTTVEGATTAPVTTVDFNNASASFGVTKSMSDGSKPDVPFTFQLTDGSRSVWPNAKYHLYSTSGERVDNVVYETDAQGKFTLKPGQAAIFFGIAPGTIYNVSEEGNPKYVQVVPLGGTGYTNKEVKEIVEILPFVNKEEPDVRVLTVTKLVEGAEGELPVNDDRFTFRLLEKTGEDTYAAVADAVYSVSVGSSTATYKTDQEGRFTLKRNETARFEALPRNKTYKVEEIDLPPEYHIEEAAQEREFTDTLHFSFTNQYKPEEIDLYIHKIDDLDEVLPGAKFALYADELLVNQVNEAELVSDAQGRITISDLKPGIYYLVELESPRGYRLLANPVKIEMVRDSQGLYVVIDGQEYRVTDPNEMVYLVEHTEENDEVHVTVTNHKNFRLPVAGGIGIFLFIAAAIAGIIVVSIEMVKKKKKDYKPEM